MSETTPTIASDQPFSRGPQPNLKLPYSTQQVYRTNCASPLKATTPTSGPTPRSCASLDSELTGFAARQSKRLRRSTGKDSGRTR